MASTQRVISSSYAGDVSPKEAWQRLGQDTKSKFIDVRTKPEWTYSGFPNLASVGRRAEAVSYKLYPNFEINPDFIKQLEQVAADKSAPLYFMCRGGVRSLDAAKAATAAGWTECYNVTGGFDGAANDQQQRGQIDGWRASNLPWQHL